MGNTRTNRWLVWVLACTALVTPGLSAAVLVQDGFDDGGRSDGPDPLDAPWYTSSTTSMVTSVVTDAGIGSGNALQAVNSTTGSARAILANFPAHTLVNPGDWIELAFDFRLQLKATPDSSIGFRFGLFNSGGTPVTADASGGSFANAVTDKGYFAALSTGATATGTLYKDLGTSTGTGSFMGGSDLNSLLSNPAFGGINDAVKHTANLRLTLNAFEDALNPGTYYNGIVLNMVLDAGPGQRSLLEDDKALGTGTTTFDEIGVASAHPNVNYIFLDNVTVTTGVPEPASVLLLALAGAALAARRR